jgi:hypothetical protein
MSPQELIALLAAVFILGMIWLRTRTFYVRRRTGPLRLTKAGQAYFVVVLVLLAIGWFAAPVLGPKVAPAMASSSTLVRVIWFLAVYYLCIPVHRLLDARKIVVFESIGPTA